MSTLADLQTACPSLQVLTEGYVLGANRAGYAGNIRFWIASSQLSTFLTTVGGVAKTITIGGTSVSRLIPLIHPYLPAAWNCYADDIHAYAPEGAIATTDGTGGGISFSDFFIDVHFATPDYYYEIGDYPCCKLSLLPGEERVTRPGSSYKFPSDGLRHNHDVGIPVKTVDFSLTMFRVPAYSYDLYQSLIGTVNITTFFGNPPGTQIYEGPVLDGQEMISGVVSFTVTHQFKYRSIPHNQIMRPDGNGFEAPVEDGTTSTTATNLQDPEYLLPEGEHNNLWGY